MSKDGRTGDELKNRQTRVLDSRRGYLRVD